MKPAPSTEREIEIFEAAVELLQRLTEIDRLIARARNAHLERVFRLVNLGPPADAEEARTRLTRIPSDDDLSRWLSLCGDALHKPGDPLHVRPLLALIIDVIPRGRPLSSTAFVAIGAQILCDSGMSIQVVASAVNELLATRKSVPTIPDLLAICRRRRDEYELFERTLRQAANVRRNADAALRRIESVENSRLKAPRPAQEMR